MNMFWLVLLFWNPAIQDHAVADGWYPIPYATEALCEVKLDYVKRYLPRYTENKEHVVECVEATDRDDAITKTKDNL